MPLILLMQATAWLLSICALLAALLQVIGMLQQVMQDTLPDAVELVTPPLRAAGSADVQAPGTPVAAAAAASAASLAGGQPRPPYTLREGVGMRRLVKFRVQAGVQLLLVQAASEVYAQHYHHMVVSLSAVLLLSCCAGCVCWPGCGGVTVIPAQCMCMVQVSVLRIVPHTAPTSCSAAAATAATTAAMQPGAMVLLADALQQVSQHARRINTDIALRKRLAAQQAGDRVQEDRCIPEPPLLRQESEASHAYLSVLMHVASSGGSGRMPGWPGAEQARQAMKVSSGWVGAWIQWLFR
jgi:hypothetical protein